MAFYFGEKEGDDLMRKINLRDINYHAKQWDHPVKSLFKYAHSMKENGGNILREMGTREMGTATILYNMNVNVI